MMRLQSGYAVSAVPASMADEAWPIVRSFISEALQYAWGYTPEHVLLKIRAGQATLWVVEKDMDIKAAAITEILEYPTCKTLNIWVLAGSEFWEWKDLLAVAEAYGRQNGCEWIECTGRPGLQRLLKDEGFNVPRVVCAKKLNNTLH